MTAVWTSLSLPEHSKEGADRVTMFPVAFGTQTHVGFCIESYYRGLPYLLFFWLLGLFGFGFKLYIEVHDLFVLSRGGSLSSLRMHLASGSGYSSPPLCH